MKKISKNINLILAVLGLLIIVFSLAAFLLWVTDPNHISYPLAVALCAISISLVLLIGPKNVTVRQRALTIACAYISMSVAFGAVYFAIFLVNPTSYSFSSAIHQGRYLEDFDEDWRALMRNGVILYAIGVLSGNTEEAYVKLNTPNGRVVIDDKRYIFKRNYTYGGGVVIASGNRLTLWDDGRSHDIGGAGIGTALANEAALAQANIVGARDHASFVQALAELGIVTQRIRQELIGKLKLDIRSLPDWKLIDFVYFSSVTLTTLGYGDIVPNSRLVRLVVMLQVFVGVSFIAFGLSVLWPEKTSHHL